MSFRHVVPNNSGTPSSFRPQAYPMHCEYGPDAFSHPHATASQFPQSYYSLPPHTESYLYHEVPHTASFFTNLQYAMPYNFARGLQERNYVGNAQSVGFRTANVLGNIATGAMGYAGAYYMQAGLTDHLFGDVKKQSRP